MKQGSQASVKTSPSTKEPRYSNQTFYSCMGDYEYVEPGKFEEALHTIHENDGQESQCFKAFQEKFKEQIKLTQTTEAINDLSKSNISIQREQFEALDPQVRMFLIFDQDTGQIYDAQNGQQVENFMLPKFEIKQAWKDFWSKSNQLNEKILNYAELGDERRLREIFENQKQNFFIDVNTRALDDWTPLHYAANEVNIIIVRILLDNGANQNAKTTMQRTPLHLSTMRGSLLVSQALVDAGADINVVDSEQETPLHMASMGGYDDLVRYFLEKNADPFIKNFQSVTALDVALNAKVLKVFQSFGIYEKEKNVYGRTWIQEADTVFHNGRNDHIMKLLSLSKGSSPMTSEFKSSPQTSKKNKFINMCAQFTKIQIQKNNSNEKNEKLGPQDFIFYQLLGKGSFGEVYLVEKIGLVPVKQFAMKILKKDRMISQNLMKYAQTEKDVLSIMNHPFIVKLNYAFQTETKLFLVMDFCPGGDLSNLLDIKRKLSENVAKIYVAEILLALETLHKNCIIYRDLKPENVVLDKDGHAMLTDFGLSKKGVQEGVLNRSFCGSPAYLPPEILQRQGHSRQVDWYLLGVMTYELLVGIPPYYANERDQLFENIKKGPLKMPKHLTSEAKDFIISLLNRDPNKRLGAKRDAEEIKNHPWLKEINFQDCYERKLIPPKSEIRQFSKVPINVKFNDRDDPRQKIDEWTFIENE